MDGNTWITNDPELAARLRKIDRAYDDAIAHIADKALPVILKVGFVRAAREERRRQQAALVAAMVAEAAAETAAPSANAPTSAAVN